MLTEPDIHANAKFWLDVADAIVKFIALLVGAAWALMNYRRGRIEPGEQIEHPLMVRIAVDESKLVGLQIKLIILSGTIVWTSSSIIEFPDPEQPAAAK